MQTATKPATVLPSLGFTIDVWNMGKVQLIQCLMHIWGLYQALLQKHYCLEKKTPTKVIDFDGNTAPLTEADRAAIVEGRISYLEIENQMLKQKLAQQQEQLAQQNEQLAQQQEQLAQQKEQLAQQKEQLAQQQKKISHLNQVVKFWMHLAQETVKVATTLTHACKLFMFDPIANDSFSENPVFCVGIKYARAFVTSLNSVGEIVNRKHPYVSDDSFVTRHFPELKSLSICARDSEKSLDDLVEYSQSQYPKS
jgi:hypothetical protein